MEEATAKEERKLPAIVLIGVGGGGSRILSEGLDKIDKHKQLDRYGCFRKATKDIMKEHKTEDMWELSFYDANDWLNELGNYIGWRDWLTQEYK